MTNRATEIKRNLFSGAYATANAILDKLSSLEKSIDEIKSLQIAVYSQLGNYFEAEQLATYFLRENRIASNHGVLAAFYLALGCIRVSQYERGRFWLAKSLRGVRWLEHNSNAGSQTNTEINSQAYFFGFQGIAFYYFFCGNFARSKRYAQKALLAAKNYKEPYGIVLSLELLAQSNYRLGYCNLALEQFKNARDEAAKAEFHQLVSAIRISELILSSQTGRLGVKAIETLKEAVGKFQVDDIYSKNELLLEVAQQMILCGRNSDARQILNSVSNSIYRVGHMRQAATLNLRLSYSMYLRGEQESARALLRSHFPRLSTNTDKALIRSYLGQ